MSKVYFKRDPAAVRALLRSAEAQACVAEKAKEALGRLGEGYEVVSGAGKNRAYARLHPATPKAYYSNRKHNYILKAIK